MVPHKYHTKSEISAALKKRLRTLRWQPEAIMREVVLIQRLRELALVDTELHDLPLLLPVLAGQEARF